jgi:hypothetical protein
VRSNAVAFVHRHEPLVLKQEIDAYSTGLRTTQTGPAAGAQRRRHISDQALVPQLSGPRAGHYGELVPSILDQARNLLTKCCPPPPQVTGVLAQTGGGSGEVQITWDPLPPSAQAAFYRVYERRGTGEYWHLAVVTHAALGALAPGKLGIVDAPDYWPWPSDSGIPPVPRCYAVTAVSTSGLEGPMSAEACGSPP